MFKISDLKCRVDLALLLNERGLTEYAVEVGVHRGDFAEPFLQKWQGTCLYLVDPWKKLPDSEYDDIVNREFSPETYDYVVNRFKLYENQVRIMRGLSSTIYRHFVDESLDFVYIDANHSYKYVKEDLFNWYSKVKHGGIISGHDVLFTEHIGVTNAVIEFANYHQLEVNLINEFEGGSLIGPCSYYMLKP